MTSLLLSQPTSKRAKRAIGHIAPRSMTPHHFRQFEELVPTMDEDMEWRNCFPWDLEDHQGQENPLIVPMDDKPAPQVLLHDIHPFNAIEFTEDTTRRTTDDDAVAPTREDEESKCNSDAIGPANTALGAIARPHTHDFLFGDLLLPQENDREVHGPDIILQLLADPRFSTKDIMDLCQACQFRDVEWTPDFPCSFDDQKGQGNPMNIMPEWHAPYVFHSNIHDDKAVDCIVSTIASASTNHHSAIIQPHKRAFFESDTKHKAQESEPTDREAQKLSVSQQPPDDNNWRQLDTAPQAQEAIYPTNLDVLYGRGERVNRHPGNIRFHRTKLQFITAYRSSGKYEKQFVAYELVDAVHGWRGRFLAKTDGQWVVKSREEALGKAKQALREYKGH